MPSKCKDRERILASGTSDIPALPVGAIRGYLCFRCFGPSSDILKCSACKRAYYCSKQCQKADWSIMHKHHCKVFKTINVSEQQQYQRTRSWDEYKKYLLQTVRFIRNAVPTDEDLRYVVQAQAYCAICRRTSVQLATSKINLNRCPHCQLVFSCTDCASTPPHSPSTCTAYQTHASIENFRIAFFEDTGKASPVTCTQFPLKTRKRLADAKGWYDYFARVSDKPQIAKIITQDFSGLTDAARKAGSATDHEAQERMRLFLLCATDNLTMPLTIVAALEDIELEKPDLKVHVVGATGRELLAMGNFEEILHLVPNVRSLYITAVGPGLATDGGSAGHDAPQLLPKTKVECCPGCKTSGRTRFFAVYSGLYHNFVSKSEYERPDLVVLFNSGWVDGDDAKSDWAPTIRSIVGSGVPALFTTYNAQEAQNEKSRLEGMGAKFLVEPAENKWRGLVPTPEFIDEEYGMWHQNAWRYVVKGQGK